MKKQNLQEYGITYNRDGYKSSVGQKVTIDAILTIVSTIDGEQANKKLVEDAMKLMKTNFEASQRVFASQALTKMGDSVTLQPKCFNPDCNDIDRQLLRLFYWTTDDTGKLLVYIRPNKNMDEYIPLTDFDDLIEIQSKLSKIQVPNYINALDYFNKLFDKICNESESAILNLMRSSNKEDAVREHIEKYFPALAYRYLCRIDVHFTTDDRGELSYLDCRIEHKSKQRIGRPTFLDYVKEVLKSSMTIALNKIDSMPIPYSTVKGIACHKYVDLDTLISDGSYPAWEEYLERYTKDEQEVFKAFVWSIVDSRCKGRQALYLLDSGYSAKSAVINAISSIIGDDMSASLQKDSLSNQFGFAKIWDKRLVVVPDNKNPNIIRTEKMHMLVSGDPCDVEFKGQNSFRANLHARVIISGNTMPQIDADATHERTRLILLRPNMSEKLLKKVSLLDAEGNIVRDSHGNPKLIGDPTFTVRLKEQLPNFLSVCKETYKKLCPTNGEIILPDTILNELYSIESVDSMIHNEFFDTYFELDKNASITKIEMYNKFKEWTSVKYQEFNNNNAYGNFTDWLNKAKNVRPVRKKVDTGNRDRVFSGVKFKNKIVVNSEVETVVDNAMDVL